MTFYSDLTEYEYCDALKRPRQLNIGWLTPGEDFDSAKSCAEVLDAIWEICSVRIASTRGIHKCDLCKPPKTIYEELNDCRILLGTSEIRVFGRDDVMYASPSLIFHYMLAHNYRPPSVFVDAILNGPRPPDAKYFDLLRDKNLAWQMASSDDVQYKSFRVK